MTIKKLIASIDKKLMMLKLDKKEEQAILKAARILKEKYPVEKVILFGSKARGDDEEGSDIDLLLLTSHPLHWKERETILGELFDIEIEFDVVISILDTSTLEWNEGIFTIFPIHDNIYHEGVVAG
ncbi:nucleotidyltransferase domain-containing protein [Desulfobacterales bacterium HSG16]|nr:nucleotidyltransferase domain-containing protein [Desulfobacterales bacterium HSG16]